MNYGYSRNIKNTVDWKLIICFLLLILIGWLNIYSAGQSSEASSIFSLGNRSGKQFLWMCLSVACAFFILFVVNPRLWEVLSTPGYILILMALVAVLVFGRNINGSRSWLVFGPVSFQPAEVSKITTSLLLAVFMSRQSFHLKDALSFAAVLLVIGIPMVLILAEKETGLTLVYMGLVFSLYREGMSGWVLCAFILCILLFICTIAASLWVPFAVLTAGILIYFLVNKPTTRTSRMAFRALIRRIIMSCIAGTGFIFLSKYAFSHILKGYQQNRIEVLLGLKDDPMGVGYNVNQSMIAIGSGGFIGKGYMKGTQTALGFVPEQTTDFIFCTIGEEWGFAGCALVLGLYAYLIFRIVMDAENCRESFTRVYGYCISGLLFMHLMINVGMTIGLMPVIGITLPFISYGGSSLLTFTVMLFIFIALYRQENKYF